MRGLYAIVACLAACGGAPSTEATTPSDAASEGSAASQGPAASEGSAAREAAASEDAAAVAETSPSRCVWFEANGHRELALDGGGRVVELYQNSDAAGSQWRERYAYDDRGRRVSIRGELLEGMGELGPQPEVVPEYTEDLQARTVEVRYPEHYWDAPRVRWTYDARGFPTLRESFGDDGSVVGIIECAYDERGRVTQRGGEVFVYRGDAALPSAMNDGDSVIAAEGDQIRVRYAGRDPAAPDDELDDGESDLRGACVDVFFAPCGPMSAPPPPGAERARLPRP